MSDSLRPHGLQPTRLLRPWDVPGRSTRVGCHFLLQCMKVKSASEVSQSYLTLCDPMDCNPPGSSVNGISQAEILSGLPFSIPGDLLTQGWNPCLLCRLHWQKGSLVPAGKRPRWGGNVNSLQYSCQGKSHGQRGLAAYSPQGHKELDTTERTRSHTHKS